MLVFDAHLDIAWNALDWNRDQDLPVSDIRGFEARFSDIVAGDATVSWPALRAGQVSTVIATLLPRLHRKHAELTFYQSREAAYGASYGQLAYYRALTERGTIRPLTDLDSLNTHQQEWEAYAADPHHGVQPPLGYIQSMEGSWSILAPGQIAEWHEAGLRILGPAHYGPDYYCHGTGSPGGLKSEGPALLREMDRAGVLLDVTHLSDQSFWEALDVYQGPVLASHHNARALVPGDRQLSDEQIKELIQRGAVIGAAFDCWMIQPGWTIGVSDPSRVSMQHIADHTDHICQLAGNANHCGIGSDLDGGFGKEQTPHDLDTIADLQKFAAILEQRGYRAEDVAGIMYQNWVRFFQQAWS